MVGVGALNSVELSDITATDTVLRPLANATGDGVAWLAGSSVPNIRHSPRGRGMANVGPTASTQWLAFQSNSAFTVTRTRTLPLLPALLLLFRTAAALLLAWHREGH